MPIILPNALPAAKILQEEKITVITETLASAQEFRPLKILLLNLMPKKIETETQFARLLGNTPLTVSLTFLRPKTHQSKTVSKEHLSAFYKTFDEIKTETFDGFIITGAPVEHLAFEEVDYWAELCEMMEWSKTHARSTLHVCWGAQAGLYYHYGINKHPVPEKLFGIFPHQAEDESPPLFRGFDTRFMIPQSRHTTVLREEIEKVNELKILCSSHETGVYAVSDKTGKQVFLTGHSEYDADTLKNEYLRDLSQGKPIKLPVNYFPADDETQTPILSWRTPAQQFYSNWLNYCVSPNCSV